MNFFENQQKARRKSGILAFYFVAAVLLIVSTTFWLIGSEGIEGTYFTLFEFARVPREAFRGVSNVLFVFALPAVVTTFVRYFGLKFSHLNSLRLRIAAWAA